MAKGYYTEASYRFRKNHYTRNDYWHGLND